MATERIDGGDTEVVSDVVPAAASGADPGSTLDRLRRDVAGALHRPAAAVDDHADLLDLGLDSIRLMSLLQAWSPPGHELDLVAFVEDPRLAAWAPRVGDAERSARADRGDA